MQCIRTPARAKESKEHPSKDSGRLGGRLKCNLEVSVHMSKWTYRVMRPRRDRIERIGCKSLPTIRETPMNLEFV